MQDKHYFDSEVEKQTSKIFYGVFFNKIISLKRRNVDCGVLFTLLIKIASIKIIDQEGCNSQHKHGADP